MGRRGEVKVSWGCEGEAMRTTRECGPRTCDGGGDLHKGTSAGLTVRHWRGWRQSTQGCQAWRLTPASPALGERDKTLTVSNHGYIVRRHLRAGYYGYSPPRAHGGCGAGVWKAAKNSWIVAGIQWDKINRLVNKKRIFQRVVLQWLWCGKEPILGFFVLNSKLLACFVSSPILFLIAQRLFNLWCALRYVLNKRWANAFVSLWMDHSVGSSDICR